MINEIVEGWVHGEASVNLILLSGSVFGLFSIGIKLKQLFSNCHVNDVQVFMGRQFGRI